MLVPLSWLREWVETELSAEELAEILTMGGLEVEGVEEAYKALGPVVSAEILTVNPHPEAEGLRVCEVTDGKDRYTIVSAAPGLEVGLKVALAFPGAITFSGTKISETKIRGIKSEGMFLSPYEAGVSEEKDRLLVLPEEASLGRPFYEVLGLAEPVLEVAITPNRGDCLSVLGVAREVAALTGAKLRFPEIPELPLGEGLEKEAEVEILEPDLCYRYAGRLITGVTVGESPFWMAKKLWMCGLRPINNLVDVTNYVLLELGQPLHAFDWEKISGRKILVRRAREGESILTLDGERRALSPDMLVIADAERPVAVAGVMGGEESAVSESTQSVFLESAWFNSISIRRTARALKLSTESSYRFERGVDPEGVILALERATALILEIAGGKVIPGRIDKYPKAWQPQVINLRLTRLKSYLKVDLSEEETAEYLKRIGGEVESKGGVLSFRPPSFRHDLSFEEDLIEEVARLYGYDRLPVSMPVAELSATAPEREEILVNEIKDILRALGFYEVINYSFISPKSLEALELQKNDSRLQVLRLANPLAETQSIMRTTLIPGLLENARFNFFREIQRLKIFEIGKVFFPRGEELPEERISLGLLILGTSQPEFWGGESRRVDIYDLKGVLEALLRELSLAGVELRPYAEEPFLKRGCSFVIEAQGRKVGFAGEVKNYLRRKFELPAPVLLAEIDISGLLELPEVPKKFRGLPRYPATSRDLTMIVRDDLPVGEVLNYISSFDIPYLEGVLVTNVYKGAPIPEGEKSVSLRFIYRSPERTLTDEEVNAIQEDVAQKIFKHFQARPR